MKKPILFSVILFYTLLSVPIKSYSQQCGFEAVFHAQVQQNPNLLNELAQSGNSVHNHNPQDEYIIPVVVHIIHSGGPENISDGQVIRAIEILNEGFSGGFDPNLFDTKIRFQLAQTDPNGCATNGIVRVFKEVQPCMLTGYDVPVPGVSGASISNWPQERFFNIWVANCMDWPQVEAFAPLATTGKPSSGITINHIYFGDTGTAASNFGSFKSIIHEAGHAFGLLHVWGPDDFFPLPNWHRCHTELEGETQGDFVSDTPPQGHANQDGAYAFCSVPPTNTCHLENPDLDDDSDNFMNYGWHYCRINHFSPGQNTKFIQSRLLDAYNNHWSSIGNQCAGLGSPLFPTVVEITQNTTWTTANLPNNGVIIMDKITVKPGATLTIGAGVELHFRRCGQTSNFVIEMGAKVILQGKLTNSLCNPTDYWYGVEVAGYEDVLQFSAAPGEIIADYGSEIEFAEYGIRNRAVIDGIEYTGGKISAYGATFRNNKYGVRFYHYSDIDKPAPGPWSIPDDGAEFVDCLFTVNVGGIVPAAIGGQLWAHIYIEGVKGITINSSIFQGGYLDTWKSAGIGIYAVDGGFDVVGRGNATLQDFSYLRNGIQTISTGNGQPFTVKKASFFGNNVGVYNSGVSNATITFNDFGYFHSSVPVRDQIGIYQEGTMSFIDIQENYFHDEHNGDGVPLNSIGICSNSTGEFDNLIRRNSFESVTVGNVANGANNGAQSGLRYLCNTNLYLTGYDIALADGASIRSFQEGPLINGVGSSAGNKFSYFNGAYTDDDIISAGAPFNYRHRTPLPTFENPLETTFGKVFKIATNVENPCSPTHTTLEAPPRAEWETNFNTEKTAWLAAKQTYFSALDGGNTAVLADYVQNNTNSTGIINTLSGLSPWVSERIFRLLIAKVPEVSAGSILNLLIQNPDVLWDGQFWIFLNNCGIFSSADIQAFETAKGTPTVRSTIEQGMAGHKAAVDYWGTLYLNDFLTINPNYSVSSYQALLQGFNDYHADALVVEEYLRNGNFTSALNLLNAMETNYCITPEEISQHSQYRQLIQIMINTYLDGRSIYEFNVSESSQIESISQSSSGLPGSLAKNILQNQIGTFPALVPCALPSTLTQLRGASSRSISEDEMPDSGKNGQMVCFPNPAGDFVQFNLSNMTQDTRCGFIGIYDSMGKLVAQKKLENSEENVIFDIRNMASGIYFYRANCGTNQLSAGKFMVKKP